MASVSRILRIGSRAALRPAGVAPISARAMLAAPRWLHSAGSCRDAEPAEATGADRAQPLDQIVNENQVDVRIGLPLDGDVPKDPKLEAIADQLSGLNMLEVADLVDIMKARLRFKDDEFSVPMMPGGMAVGGAAPAAAAAAEEAPAEEEKTHFKVVLKGFEAKAKIKLIKEVRGITGLGLKEAKALVEGTPADVAVDVKKEDAEAMATSLRDLGGEVDLV